jgi:alanine dehydrogenase
MRILNNQELEAACDMRACIQALYEGIRAYARGDAARRPRMELFTPTARPDEWACFSTMDGIIRGRYYALRIKPDILAWPVINGVRQRITYCSRPGLYGGLVLVFRTEDATLQAIMNDGYVQHMRVGALAALGARYLARPDASVVGILGSGGMARAFAEGFAVVRPVQTIKVYSPTREHLHAYCAEMTDKLQIEVVPMDGPEAVVRGSHVVAACTTAMDPVILGQWLEPGQHLANVTRWELDDEVMRRITLVGQMLERQPLQLNGYSDDNFEVHMNAMAYISGQPDERRSIPEAANRVRDWQGAPVVTCVDWATEQPAVQRSPDDVTILAELAGGITGDLASSGIQGLQFAAVAGRAYELAAAQGLGMELPTDMFLQDVPT